MRRAGTGRSLELHVERGGVLRAGERVVVACSGGPDSVALAALLQSAASLRLTLTLAYVHHGTRRSAWQDECIVANLAAALDIPLRTAALNGIRGEARLRDARYAALAEIARAEGGTAVATGHHAGDQSETVLLALFRGTGPSGLAGMEARRPLADGIDLVRPLLRLEPAALAEYCGVTALPYAVDPTNADPSLRRNAVRAALERLRQAFPGLDAAVARTAELLADEVEGSPRAGLRRQVREVLRHQSDLDDVDFAHVDAVARALERGATGRFFMKEGVTLTLRRGTLSIGKDHTT